MSVQRNVTTNLGAISLDAHSCLQYTLEASGANPIFNFACQHSVRQEVHDDPKPLYRWFLKTPPIPVSDPVFQPDTDPASTDVYLVSLSFVAILSYKLKVVELPANVTVQEISYSSDDATDVFREPLTVQAL
jgi:hypothetical protein